MYSPWSLGESFRNESLSPLPENEPLPIFSHVISGAGHPEALHVNIACCLSLPECVMKELVISGGAAKIKEISYKHFIKE